MMNARLASRRLRSRLMLFVLALSLGLAPILRAQTPVLHFEHISELGAVIWDIHQDQEGFLWFATAHGLYRYDGYSFREYVYVPEDSTSLLSTNVDFIFEDREGVLWFVTVRSGNKPAINRYNRETDSFTRFPYDPEDVGRAVDNVISAIHEDRSGTFWIATRGDGLSQFDRTTGAFTRIKQDSDDPASLKDNFVHSIYEDQEGGLWFGLDSGLSRFDRERGAFAYFAYDPNDPTSIGAGAVTPMLEDSKGRFWIGTNAGGLCRMDREQITFTCYRHDVGSSTSLSSDQLSTIFEDASGMLWVGTSGGGLNRYDPERSQFERFAYDSNSPSGSGRSGLRSGVITSIYQDRSGVLWIGTWGGGLSKLARVAPLFTAHIPPGGSELVWSLQEDRLGRLWLGTASGLHRLDRRTAQWTSFLHDPSNPKSLSFSHTSALHEDRSGVPWAGTWGGGLNRYDEQTNTFTRFQYDPDDSASLSSDHVVDIYEDRAGRFWIATYDGGLNLMDRQSGTFTRFVHDPNDRTSIGPAVILAVHEDSKGRFWIGTNAGGLNLMDREKGTFTRLVNDPKNPESLSGNDINSITEDAAGVLWIGTFDTGLNHFDPQTGSIIRYNKRNSCLSDNRIVAVLKDDEGHLWLNTGQGVVRFDPRTNTCVTYGTYDGLASREGFFKDAHRSRSGEFFFTSFGGVHSFFPAQFKQNTEPPTVVLTDFKLFNHSVAPGPSSPLKRRITQAKEIVLKHDQNSVGFEFAALHFIRPEQNQYAYRLEGFDQDWMQAGNLHTASYTNLGPGAYVFRVKAANSDGVWNEEGTSVRMVILPPWWRTWWAYALYGLLVGATVFAVDRTQRRRLIGRERTRAERETEKLRAEAAEAWANYLQSENQRQTQELEQARDLQLSMLPERVPEHPTVELAAFMKTATEVGGDYYDFDLSDDGMLTIIIGDATGHGASAGTMVTATKGILNVLSDEEDLEQVLMVASEAVRRMHMPKLFMALALVRLRDHTLELAGAGMPPALVYRAASECIEEVALKGMPLGSPGGFPYRRQCMLLSPGDTVVLMSDGFPELLGASGQRLGYDRMAGLFAEAAAGSPEEVIAHFMETAKAWCNGQMPDDDMTFVVMKVKA